SWDGMGSSGRCECRWRHVSCADAGAPLDCSPEKMPQQTRRPMRSAHRGTPRTAMLDLGTSFLASVARDPKALAIVDGDVRLSYSACYKKISALVAAFDALGLRAGDHLVTVLQNRWEAATIHWACQFAGIIVTPLNWRSTAEELGFCLDDAEAKAVIYDEVSAAAVHSSSQAANARASSSARRAHRTFRLTS